MQPGQQRRQRKPGGNTKSLFQKMGIQHQESAGCGGHSQSNLGGRARIPIPTFPTVRCRAVLTGATRRSTQERGLAFSEDDSSWSTAPFRHGRSGQAQNAKVSGPPVTGAKYFPLDLQWDREEGNSKLEGLSQASSAPRQGKSRRSRPTRRKQKHKSLDRRGGHAVWRSFDSLCHAVQQQDSISATERIVLDLEALLQDKEEDFPFLKRLVDGFLNALTDQLYFMDLPMLSKVALYYGSQPKTKGGTTLKVTTANVTSWRKQVLDWHCASKGEILLVQETHLHGEDLMAFGIQAYKAGYHHFGGEGSPRTPGCSSGCHFGKPRDSPCSRMMP